MIDANETKIYLNSYDKHTTSVGQSTLPVYDILSDSWDVVRAKDPFNVSNNLNLYTPASSHDAGGSASFFSAKTRVFSDYGQDLYSEKYHGLITIDVSNSSNLIWKLDPSIPMPYLPGSTTQYVRYGATGVLVSIGGWISQPPLVSETLNYSGLYRDVRQSRSFNSTFLRSMSQIQIFDIAAGHWIEVTATGDIPPPRCDLCSALSVAPDDSSFIITVYGGIAGRDPPFADLYALIMPAFHWIKINASTTDDSLAGQKSDGRRDHFCLAYKDRYMFVLGGEGSISTIDKPCTDSPPALRMLDLTTFEWQNQALINKPYEVPQAVIDIVGGGPSGGANPTSSWQQVLGENIGLFNKTIARRGAPTILKTKNDGGGANTNPVSYPSGGRKGIIVGSTIGVIVGVVIGGSFSFYVSRRRKQSREENDKRASQKPELENSIGSTAIIPPLVEIDNAARELELDGSTSIKEAPAAEHCPEVAGDWHASELPGS
ncbi:uncharacterized protein KY384_008653 [Bacidia gigantensis]|uniref:uncharacterized protein n=1 Tax=Bacidia gigantensis TaxID=2732470 RepID=UPI001D059914|nr:uncharacterized protein KY384_008653 [Bacidia gigantensis]KAG8527223.1 hypothetical protein KY384_008653 [Bacidia gigantensis]